jgi:hypothetical protein
MNVAECPADYPTADMGGRFMQQVEGSGKPSTFS